jgi:hypothetical protein
MKLDGLKQAGVAQLVEHQPSKLGVVSSNLIARSIFYSTLTVPGQDDCIAAAKNPNLGYKDLVRCNEDHYSRESVESCLDQVN